MNKKSLLTKFKNIRSPHHKGEFLLLSTLSILKKKNADPQKTLETVLTRLSVGVKILAHIRAGKIIPFPASQREESSKYCAIKMLLNAAREGTTKSFVPTNLTDEITAALGKQGRAYKSKLDVLKDIKYARINLRKAFKRFKYKAKKNKKILRGNKGKNNKKPMRRVYNSKTKIKIKKIFKKKKKKLVKVI